MRVLLACLLAALSIAGQQGPRTTAPACKQCANWSAPIELVCYTRTFCQPKNACEECSKLWCEWKLGEKLDCGAAGASNKAPEKPPVTGNGGPGTPPAPPNRPGETRTTDASGRTVVVTSVPGPTLPPTLPPSSGSSVVLSDEIDTTRLGSDYHDFALPASRPELCRDACASDPYCKAYGYTKPGAGSHGSSPWCYLKNAVPDPVRHTCCIGGVKSAGSPK